MDEYRIALAQNIATNGRWFCALMVAICLYADLDALAVLAAVPVGLAVIADQLPAGMPGRAASNLAYLLAAFTPVAVIINLILR